MEYSELRAPYPALVLGVEVQPGQTVVNRVFVTPMVSITRSDRLAIRALAAPQQAARLASGQSVKVRVGGTQLDAVVVDPGLILDPDSADLQYRVEVRFDRPHGGEWRAGQPAEIVTKGRHDPCVGLRATPIAEAMVALVLMDHYLRHRAQNADVNSETPTV